MSATAIVKKEDVTLTSSLDFEAIRRMSADELHREIIQTYSLLGENVIVYQALVLDARERMYRGEKVGGYTTWKEYADNYLRRDGESLAACLRRLARAIEGSNPDKKHDGSKGRKKNDHAPEKEALPPEGGGKIAIGAPQDSEVEAARPAGTCPLKEGDEFTLPIAYDEDDVRQVKFRVLAMPDAGDFYSPRHKFAGRDKRSKLANIILEVIEETSTLLTEVETKVALTHIGCNGDELTRLETVQSYLKNLEAAVKTHWHQPTVEGLRRRLTDRLANLTAARAKDVMKRFRAAKKALAPVAKQFEQYVGVDEATYTEPPDELRVEFEYLSADFDAVVDEGVELGILTREPNADMLKAPKKDAMAAPESDQQNKQSAESSDKEKLAAWLQTHYASARMAARHCPELADRRVMQVTTLLEELAAEKKIPVTDVYNRPSFGQYTAVLGTEDERNWGNS